MLCLVRFRHSGHQNALKVPGKSYFMTRKEYRNSRSPIPYMTLLQCDFWMFSTRHKWACHSNILYRSRSGHANSVRLLWPARCRRRRCNNVIVHIVQVAFSRRMRCFASSFRRWCISTMFLSGLPYWRGNIVQNTV